MAELARSYTILPSNDSTVAVEVCRSRFGRRQKYILYFESFRGEMTFARDDLAAFKIQLNIDPRSVACFRNGLSEKTRRKVADFARDLLASGGREIQFTAGSLRAKPLRGYAIEGVLHVRGISRVVTISAVLSPLRKDTLQIDGDSAIRLSDFDLPCPSSLFGLLSTRDEAPIRLLLWATAGGQVGHATV
jgi:polyisoprenoid-binding protein YceI